MQKHLDPIPLDILERHAAAYVDLVPKRDGVGAALPHWEQARRAFLLELAVNPFNVESAKRLSAILAPPETRVVMLARAKASAWGRQSFEERPRVRVRMSDFRELPTGSLGRAIADWLDTRDLNPDDMPVLPVTDDHDFLRAHIWETHDVWHTVTEFDCDPLGELSIQALVQVQLQSPFAATIQEAALLHAQVRDHLDQVAPGSATSTTSRFKAAMALGARMGEQARPFFGFPWGEHWATPLEEVRGLLDIPALG